MGSTSPDTSSSLPPLQWKFSQVFGEKVAGEDVQNVDLISAIEFDKSGRHLAVGDRGGRVIIFESKDDQSDEYLSRNEMEAADYGKKELHRPIYHYKAEFQSHEPEFDYLKSLEIEEKINTVRWCTMRDGLMFLLSANDKTIKLWKVKEHKVKKLKEMDHSSAVHSENALLANGSFVSLQEKPSHVNGYHQDSMEQTVKNISPVQQLQGKISSSEDSVRASCRKVYAHAHDFNINSVSNNSDGETFISADDLRINLWNLDVRDQCFNIIDIKPSNMEDLTEVITSAEFHPIHCNLLAYSSSRGFIRLVDMRQSALCDKSARILQDTDSHLGSKSFFTEIIASVSDIKFTNDGQHILSRDFMNLKLWDIRKDSTPVKVLKIHEHLRPKLCDLYNDDSIFDKFECCVNGDGSQFATGSYSNLLHIFSHGGGSTEEHMTIEAGKNPSRNRKPTNHSAPRARRSSLSNLTRGFYRQGHGNSSSHELGCDVGSKLLHMAWNPASNLIACSAGSSLFMYHA
ncbi:Serine/threonine protein phosphatase 2A 55 kDa regulatory subunit B beta isoform [Linum grandiflorum]